MEATILACFLLMFVDFPSHAVAQGDIESIIQNAVDRAFGDVSGGGGTLAVGSFGPPDGGLARPAPRVLGQIPAFRTTETRQEPSAASGAAGALARFSQTNSPSLNAIISDRFKRTLNATMFAAEQLSSGPMGLRESLNRVTSDPSVTEIFQRLVTKFCFARPTCDIGNPYRRVDGQCNNLRDPLLGSSGTPQQRVLSPAYESMGSPRRRSVTGEDLPNARIVSNNVFQYLGWDMTPVSAVFSTYLTHHGQFIDHDVIATPLPKDEKGEDILDCCNKTRNYPEHCFNIEISKEDPFYRGKTCMNFVRHFGGPSLNCAAGTDVREQMNDRTAFVDGSMVYGSTCIDERKLRGGLRSFGGRLAVNYQNLPPRREKGCPRGIVTKYTCFMAGDHRPSETPTLTVPHITWLRRHNLIADALRQATGIQDDELLFQEAKRIVVAELQHVTYNEFLAVLLDKYTRNFFNLRSRRRGHNDIYNSRIDPRTINAFGVAAYRMGHSLVRNVVGHDYGTGHVKEFEVSKHFERPDLMYNGGYEYMARWMSRAQKSRSDRFLVDGIRNRLFEFPEFDGMPPSETLSFDLGALNIQRGRDHGIPSYNAYREFCGLPRARFFATVRGGLVDHSRQAVAALQRTYRHPDDIDLYAGGLSETPRQRTSILGPTFQCLIGLQFHLYKHGDRFWYERQFPENRLAAFTQAELAQIKQTTYSKIVCSVLKTINGRSNSFQRNLLLRPHRISNPVQSCRRILRGSRLGFDIRPFARQLLSLGRLRYSASRASSCMARDRGRVPDRPPPAFPLPAFPSPINPGSVLPIRRRIMFRRPGRTI